MGFDKLAAELAGIPVLARTLLAFQNTPAIAALVVVARDDSHDWVNSLAQEHSIAKLFAVVTGGKERQDSVLFGLRALREAFHDLKWAAVHDGARPLISPESIAQCFGEAQEFGSGCLATPVTDTLKRADANRKVVETVDRTSLWAMQTPQIFPLQQLIQAYETVINAGRIATDEAAAMEFAGHPVHLVANSKNNAKITYKDDLQLAELWLRGKT